MDEREPVACGWCDELTPPDAPCVECGGNPRGPFAPPDGPGTGNAVARERRAAARAQLLTAARPWDRRSAAGSVAEVDELRAPPAPDSSPDRLRAALELAADIEPSPWTLPAPAQPQGVRWPEMRVRRRRVARPMMTGLIGAGVVVVAGVVAGFVLLGSHPTKAPPVPTSPPASIAATTWAPFRGPGFSVDLPAPPRVTSQPVTGLGVSLTLTEWDAATPSGEYLVGSEAFPAGQAVNIDRTLQGAVQGAARNSQAAVVSTTRSTIGPFGVEDAVMTRGTEVLDMRIMASGTHVWMLLGLAQGHTPAGYERFLQSFNPAS